MLATEDPNQEKLLQLLQAQEAMIEKLRMEMKAEKAGGLPSPRPVQCRVLVARERELCFE